MNVKRTWLVASATLALAGFTGAGVAMASDDVQLNDPRNAPVTKLSNDSGTVPAADTAHSANSAADSPGDQGYVPPAPADTANTPDSANSPAQADTANSPNQPNDDDDDNGTDDD